LAEALARGALAEALARGALAMCLQMRWLIKTIF